MSSPVNVGDVLADKYRVERVLGVGGMGVVVAAKHLTLGERVAIKFLLPQALARADVVARFTREGQAAARLRSEHVTRVIDVGKLSTGEPYLVMEYLDGHDLAALLRDQGPLAPEHAIELVLQACEALAEAHANGIVHRDLKPSNLFVIKRIDGSPSVKLIDFGISKIQLEAEGDGEMTATAVMMGSPLYMAPEQMASARDVDGRADIWSVGIILHTLLAGAPPFRAPTVMGVYELIVQGAPPIRTLRPDVPAGLEAAILKCLQKDRRQRFDDVGALAEALAPFGPAGSQTAADRIKRIGATRRPGSGFPPPPDAPVTAVTPGTAATGTPAAAPPSSGAIRAAHAPTVPATGSTTGSSMAQGPTQPTGPSLASDPQVTDGPWDQRTHPPTSRRRPLLLLVAAAAITIAVTAPVAFLALRSQSGAKLAPAADASGLPGAPTTTAAPGDPRQPAVSPAGPAQPADAAPGASATPSVSSAAPSAAPAAPPTANPRGPRPGPPGPAPAPPPAKAPRARSAEDLFGTQK
jgi:serine/threonine-protein kinase